MQNRFVTKGCSEQAATANTHACVVSSLSGFYHGMICRPGSVFERSCYVAVLQIRVIRQDFCSIRSCGKEIQNIAYAYPKTSNSRLPSKNCWIGCDPMEFAHDAGSYGNL